MAASDPKTHDHGDGHDHDHGLSHVTPVRLLIGVFVLLLVLTWLTVAVTALDYGHAWNLFIAMAVASAKAALVCLYFMHLRWENPLNVIVAVSSLLFALLFVAITLMDRGEYRDDIRWADEETAQVAP